MNFDQRCCFAGNFSGGARCVRVDLHLHTLADQEFKYSSKNREDFVRAYIQKLKERAIRIGVITNHNKFDEEEFEKLSEEGVKEGVLLLPGVELSVNEGRSGIHILVVFSPEAARTVHGEVNSPIEKFLANAFVSRPRFDDQGHPCLCALNLEETIQKLDEFQVPYFVVLAHADQDKGFFKELKGSRIKDFLKSGFFRTKILALQDLAYEKYKLDWQMWVTEIAREEGRDAINYRPALIRASDPKKLAEVGRRYTCLKVGELSFEALKFALAQHELRLQPGCVFPVQYPHIKQVTADTGKMLKEMEVFLNPDLNNFIGIRGAGKSALVETIRYVLDLEPKADVDYKNGLLQYAVGSGGKVALDVYARGQSYRIERIYEEQPKVYREGEYIPHLHPREIFPVVYYGQKDLQKQVESKPLRMELIDQFIQEPLSAIRQQIKSLEEKIKEKVNTAEGLQKKVARKQEFAERRAALEEKIAVFQNLQIAGKLKKEANFKKDELALERVESFFLNWTDGLNTFKNEASEFYTAVFPLESAENPGLFKELKAILEDLFIFLNGKVKDLEQAIQSARKEFQRIRESFQAEKEKILEEIAQIKRQINVSFVSPDDYGKLIKELEQVKVLQKELERYEGKVRELRQQKEQLYEELQRLWHQEWRARNEKAGEVNSAQNLIHLDVLYKGDKEQFLSTLQNIFQGTGIRRDRLEKVARCYQDGIEILRALDERERFLSFGFTEKEWLKFYERAREQEKLLGLYRVPDALEIKYGGQLISKLSLGQRASALLILLLSFENIPVIIDQPEDDLDSQTIYRGLIKELLKLKRKRQIIFATHNPNIPVLGDCEQVAVFRFGDNQIEIDEGSIDHKAIQQSIVEIMEGGREAFSKRKEIYNQWIS
jgi:cell division septum initiation protein DivIVA